jgi:hypothetical protein
VRRGGAEVDRMHTGERACRSCLARASTPTWNKYIGGCSILSQQKNCCPGSGLVRIPAMLSVKDSG